MTTPTDRPNTPSTEQTALVPAPPPQTAIASRIERRGVALHTMSDFMACAGVIARSGLAPNFRTPEAVFVALQHGAELGLGPMQSVQAIAVINGRPSIYGDAALALVVGSGQLDDFSEWFSGEGASLTAHCRAQRRGRSKPIEATFSVADAQRAGLWGKSGPWTFYPRRMLQMRARGFCLRDGFPDVLRGLKCAEEVADYAVADPQHHHAIAATIEGPPAESASSAESLVTPAAVDPKEDLRGEISNLITRWRRVYPDVAADQAAFAAWVQAILGSADDPGKQKSWTVERLARCNAALDDEERSRASAAPAAGDEVTDSELDKLFAATPPGGKPQKMELPGSTGGPKLPAGEGDPR